MRKINDYRMMADAGTTPEVGCGVLIVGSGIILGCCCVPFAGADDTPRFVVCEAVRKTDWPVAAFPGDTVPGTALP
jgi:hypothetical protein